MPACGDSKSILRRELEIVLNDNDIDIIGLSETRLDETVRDSDVNINGYNIYRNDRNTNGGGVAIYVKESLSEPTVKIKSDKLELVALEFTPNHAKPFLVMCWYRPPTSGVDDASFENLRDILRKVDKEEKEMILIGDTNCDFKNNQNANAKKLKTIYSEFQFTQLINKYTRVAITTNEQNEQKTTKTLIDHFSTTSPRYILRADVLRIGMVDHYMVYAIRKINAWRLKKKKPKIIESRSLSRYNKELFRNDLRQIDWSTILDPLSENPYEMASAFQEIFELILDMHAPLKKRRVRGEFAPWLNQSIRNLMRERDLAKRAAEKSPEKWSLYKQLRNKVTKEIRVAVQSHYHGLINENKDNPKKMWQTINNVLDRSSKSTMPASLDIGGKKLTKEGDIVEALNHHFVSVGPKLASKIEQNANDDPLQHINNEPTTMRLTPVDDNYVPKAIKQLKNGKAPGPDKIPIILIKDAVDLISKPLTLIFNSSLWKGIFPDVWKLARVTPIFKSGSKSVANNYRPISVISVFSRILERIVHDQVYEYLKVNKVLTMSQSAFQKLCSTITSLIDSTDYWYENIDHKQLNLAIFLDLKKAFDTVDHKILLEKLRKYGIRELSGDWFESYLKNRRQYCAANGYESRPRTVTCGIPQGSCLGPLLFIIYLNDFEKCLKVSKAGMYADDTHVTVTSMNVEELVHKAQEELTQISEYMRLNKLSANPQKTEYMIIGHPRRTNKVEIHETLRLNGADIKRVKKTKSLGVIVDEGLNWEEQFKIIKGKVSGGLTSLKKLKNILPQSQLSNVYRALVESHMRYADVIWGSLTHSKKESLQRLQDRAIFIIETARIKDKWSNNLLSAEQLVMFDRAVMAYKIMNRLCPENLWNKFQRRSHYSNYNTRFCRDLQIPRYNLEYAKKGFSYSALKVWNEIPISIRELPTLCRFKKQLKMHLMS